MNEDLKILKENQDEIIFSWNEDEIANSYTIFLVDNSFNNVLYKEQTCNYIEIDKRKLEDIIGVKVEYNVVQKGINKHVSVGYSKTYKFNSKKELDSFTVSAIKSYKGISLSFFSLTIYDLYKIYIYKKNKKLELYKTTEDFQISGKEIKEGNEYIIEAYKYEGKETVLKATSGVYKVKTHDVVNKSKKPKISVIIPVYNSEAYIGRCVDSVLFSTFTNLELLLINDGSKDNSKKIITWYQKNYPSIVKVFNKKNEGVSYTRNKGIDLATGEYIAFIDNDDMVHPYMYEALYNCAKESKVDVAIAKTIIREDMGKYDIYMDYKSQHGEKYFTYDFDTMMDISINMKPQSIYFVAIWNKIVKASVAKGRYFDKQNHYEDQAYTRMLYSWCNSFAFVYDAYYMWDKRIQRTKGTQSNFGYIANNMDELHVFNVYVLKANLYAFYYGNPKRIKLHAYLFLKDGYEMLKARNELEKGRLRDEYVKVAHEMNKDVDLLKDKFIKDDKDIYKFTKALLED